MGAYIIIQDQERINDTRKELRKLKNLSIEQFKRLSTAGMDYILAYLITIEKQTDLTMIDYCCDKIKEILKLPKTPIDLAWTRSLTGQFNYKYCTNMVWSDLMRFNK